MIDENTIKHCKLNKNILELKIKNTEHAIYQSQQIISESEMDTKSLLYLKRKIAESLNDLEILNLIKLNKL